MLGAASFARARIRAVAPGSWSRRSIGVADLEEEDRNEAVSRAMRLGWLLHASMRVRTRFPHVEIVLFSPLINKSFTTSAK